MCIYFTPALGCWVFFFHEHPGFNNENDEPHSLTNDERPADTDESEAPLDRVTRCSYAMQTSRLTKCPYAGQTRAVGVPPTCTRDDEKGRREGVRYWSGPR